MTSTTNFNIINNGQPTHKPGTAIDHTVVSPELTADLEWQVTTSLLISDHYPIIIYVTTKTNEEPEMLNYKCVIWEEVRKDDEWKNISTNFDHPKTAYESLCQTLNKVRENHVPKYKRYYPKIWWSEECKKAWKARESSYRIHKATGAIEDCIA